MKIVVGICVLVSALLLAGCGSDSDTATDLAAETPTTTSQEPFGSYEFKPPESEYDGPFFELSQDYPTEIPPTSETPDFFDTNFRKDWRGYLIQVGDYCFEGNTEVEWRVQKNEVRDWYHMPWQDYGENGREAIHGLTKEAPVGKYQLASTQSYAEGGAYAVGFYNNFGGYTIGQVWKDHENPDPEFTSTEGFPIGTVVCKLLFLSAPPAIVAEQIPFLTDPIEWQAYTRVTYGEKTRKVQDVALIQMDVMVRDERASAGWVFGTFQYNGELGNENRWDNLAPVGLMWGNDPQDEKNIPVTNVTDGREHWPELQKFDQTPINAELQETAINEDPAELPPTHLGWNGRLNGPVDNSLSSCMSCHMTASSPEEDLSPLFTEEKERPHPSGTPEWDRWWMQWFENVGWKNGELEKFMNAEHSLDFSLQLSAALQNFYKSRGVRPENPVRR